MKKQENGTGMKDQTGEGFGISGGTELSWIWLLWIVSLGDGN